MYIHTIPVKHSEWEAAVQHRELSLVLSGDLHGWVGVGGKVKREWSTHIYS